MRPRRISKRIDAVFRHAASPLARIVRERPRPRKEDCEKGMSTPNPSGKMLFEEENAKNMEEKMYTG